MSRNAQGMWNERELDFFNYALSTLDFACSDQQGQAENFNPVAIIDNLFFQIKNFYGYRNIEEKNRADNFIKFLLCGYQGMQHPLLTACANFNSAAVSAIMKNIWQLQNPEINALVTENLLTSYLFEVDQTGSPIFERHDNSAISNALNTENTLCLFELIHGVRMLFNDDSRCHNCLRIILQDFDQEDLSIRTHKTLAQFGLSQHLRFMPPQQQFMQPQNFVQDQLVMQQNMQQQATVQQPVVLAQQESSAPLAQQQASQESASVLSQPPQSSLSEENDEIYRIGDGHEEEEMVQRMAAARRAAEAAKEFRQQDQAQAIQNINEVLLRGHIAPTGPSAEETAQLEAQAREKQRIADVRKQKADLRKQRNTERQAKQEERLAKLKEQQERIKIEQAEMNAIIAKRKEELEREREQSLQAVLVQAPQRNVPDKYLGPIAPARDLPPRPAPKSTREKLPTLADANAGASASGSAAKKSEQKSAATVKVKTASFKDLLQSFGTKYAYAYIMSDFLDEDQEKKNLMSVQKEFVDFVQFLHGVEIKDFNLRANHIFRPSYVDFDAIADYWIYYDYGNEADRNAGEKTVTKLSKEHDRIVKKALYFMSNQQEIPLWLQRDIAQNGGVKAIAEMIPNSLLRIVFASQKAAQLPPQASLQDLLIKGATFEEIEDYIKRNAKTNPKNLEVFWLNRIVTHPQSAKILALLDRTKIEGRPILTPELLNKAFTEAAEIGAFDFFTCKKEWAQAWIDSDEIKAALAKSSLSYKDVEQEEEDLLVNILRAAEKADLKTPPLVKTTNDPDQSVSSRVLMKFLYSSIILRDDIKGEKDFRRLFKKFSQFANMITGARQDVVNGKKVLTIDTDVATKAVINATKLVALQNPESFVPVARAAIQTLSMQKEFDDMLLEAYYNDYITAEHGVSLVSDVLKRLLKEQKIEAFEETLRFLQDSGQDTMRTILKEKPFDDESISKVVAKHAPQAFERYYKQFIKPLDSEQKQTLYRIEPRENTQTYFNSFLNDAVKACLACNPANFKTLQEILKDIQDTVRIDVFYDLLTTKLETEEKTPLAMIKSALQSEYDPQTKKYFQKLLKETKEKAEHLKNYDRFIEESSQRFMPALSDLARSPAVAASLVDELLAMTSPDNAYFLQSYFYEKTNIVSRLISHLNNKSIFPFSTTELGYLSPTVVKNIIYNFLAYDSEAMGSNHNFPAHNFEKAKALKQISKEEELAVETVFHGLMVRPFPLWMLDKIEAVGKKAHSDKAAADFPREELINKGFARIRDAIKNPAIKRFIIFEKAPKTKKTESQPLQAIEGAYPIKIAKEGEAKTLRELVYFGAPLSEFLKFFTTDKKKDYNDINDVHVAILITHPHVNEIRDLIWNHYKNPANSAAQGTLSLLETHLFDAAIVSGNRDYFVQNKDRFELILNTILKEKDTGPVSKIIPTIVNSSFEGQRAMLPVYGCISQLHGHPLMRVPFPFATPAGLLEHMKKATEIDPAGFYDYLLEVKAKIPEKNFKMLLINDLRVASVGIIDLVHQTNPQKLDPLKTLYGEVFTLEQMKPYEAKFARLKPTRTPQSSGNAETLQNPKQLLAITNG